MSLPERLPKSNPVCLHDWRQAIERLVFICGSCGYTVSYEELCMRQEGEPVGIEDYEKTRRRA